MVTPKITVWQQQLLYSPTSKASGVIFGVGTNITSIPSPSDFKAGSVRQSLRDQLDHKFRTPLIGFISGGAGAPVLAGPTEAGALVTDVVGGTKG